MGEVWEARHRHLARRVAVKIVRPDALGPLGDEARWLTLRQFEREARATAALRSPHTVEVYDFGLSADGTFYYAMEFLDGRDLDTWVRRFGPMPPARVRHVLRQLVHSLADAHANGLVHRDVKPANIYLCRRGRDVDVVKVLDFGLVIENPGAGRAPDLVQLHETGRAGTLGFMAPEQVERGAAVDHRADVYATGRVGFWLLRGGDGTAMPEPSALEAVLARCVRPDPAGRPASMEELAALLDRCPAGDWDAAAARAWWAAHPDA
jgi:serine/threonine-protein kinase